MNLLNALPGAVAQGLIWGIMAIGVYITFKILDVADLTVDGSICTGAAVCAVLLTKGVNVGVALLIALLAGMVCGLVTGFFHTIFGIPVILSGILTQLMLWSVNLKIMGRANIPVSSRKLKVLITSMRINKSILIVLGISVVLIALLYWFFGTERGCALRATGCNLAMSRAQGINTGMNKVIGIALSNGIVALSGGLLCQYQGFSDINMGRGAIVIGLAAVIIGEAVFSRISRNFAVRLFGVIVGGVIYYMVYQTVISLGIDSDLLKMFSALVVAVFLAVPHIKSTYFRKKVRKEVK